MDPTLIAEEPGGFYAWIMEYGQIVAFLAQIIYWTGMLVLLFYAVWQFKRWVNFQLGTGRSGQLRDADVADKPSVDEFVE